MKFTKPQYLLFLPFLIAFTEFLSEEIGFTFGIFDESDADYFSYFHNIFEVFNVIYSFILIINSYLLILKYEKEHSLFTPKNPKIGLKWLKTITIILFCLCLYWPIPLYYEIKMDLSVSEVYFYALWVGLAFVIYSLGHIGLYQFGIVQEQKNIRKFSTNRPTAIPLETISNKSEHIEAFEKFVKNKKNYLDASLSLDSTAEALGINKSYLSRIINAELEKSFSDYVNELRVEEAKSYLENSEFRNYTLVSIGLEAGFNSKSTFNSTFKKFTGLTPSEYKMNLGNNA